MSMFYGYDQGHMVGNIFMGDNTISNVRDLTFSNTLDSVSLNNKQLKQLSAPTDPQDAASKGYTDTHFLKLSGGTMAGNIAMDNNIISNIKNLTFSDTFDRIDLNGKQLKQLGNPTDPQDVASKNYTDTNFLQLSGGTMTGPITLHSNPTEDFHPCTKLFAEQLVRWGNRRIELAYKEWGYRNINRADTRHPGGIIKPIIVGSTLTESFSAALNILAVTFVASPDKARSIDLSFILEYTTKNGVDGNFNLGTVVVNNWHYGVIDRIDTLNAQINKEYNLHRTITKAVATSIRYLHVAIKQGRGGSDLPGNVCTLLVSLSQMV